MHLRKFGFTLIEILVSVVASTLLLLAALSFYSGEVTSVMRKHKSREIQLEKNLDSLRNIRQKEMKRKITPLRFEF